MNVWPASYQVYVQLWYPNGRVTWQGWTRSYRNSQPNAYWGLYSYNSSRCTIS